jgi:hypothetical protein
MQFKDFEANQHHDIQLMCFSGRNEIVGCQSTVRPTTYMDLHELTVFAFDRTAPEMLSLIHRCPLAERQTTDGQTDP